MRLGNPGRTAIDVVRATLFLGGHWALCEAAYYLTIILLGTLSRGPLEQYNVQHYTTCAVRFFCIQLQSKAELAQIGKVSTI